MVRGPGRTPRGSLLWCISCWGQEGVADYGIGHLTGHQLSMVICLYEMMGGGGCLRLEGRNIRQGLGGVDSLKVRHL